MFRTTVLAAALALAALSTSAKADPFVASPQDYPTPAAYAAAYAAAGQEQLSLQDKVFNPNAYQCGEYCKQHLAMTASERQVFLNSQIGAAGGGQSPSGH